MFLFLIDYYTDLGDKDIYLLFIKFMHTFVFYFNCKFYTLTLMRTFDRGFSYCRNFISDEQNQYLLDLDDAFLAKVMIYELNKT